MASKASQARGVKAPGLASERREHAVPQGPATGAARVGLLVEAQLHVVVHGGAEALGVHPIFERLSDVAGAVPVAYEPSIQIALDDDCRVQCRVSVETRTLANQIRTGQYLDDQLSVYLTTRRFGSLEPGETYASTMQRLSTIGLELLDNYVVDSILQPLQHTIALK